LSDIELIMQMTTAPAAYLLPGPPPTIGSKSPLIKQMLPAGTVPASLHPVQLPLHRPPIPSHPHHQFSRPAPNTADAFHSLTVTNPNNGNSLLTTSANSNPSSAFGTNNAEENSGSSGSGGHSLSQSMESINNIGFTDDEVRKT
jgi:hypothetical protein